MIEVQTMTPDRMQQIAELYHPARESAPGQRAALLSRSIAI
jgi:hypothetical protein